MIRIQHLGVQPYQTTWEAMKAFTLAREPETPDELWLLEHPPVYTQGQAGKPEHVLNPQSIPLVQSDRGGQVTYHGPGQLVGYVLLDLKKNQLNIKTLVQMLEDTLIAVLTDFDIPATTQCGAPGVYVHDKKIASIGLRVKKGYSYHGIALNVDMDLTPFQGINPCGYQSLAMTQIKAFCPEITMEAVMACFGRHFSLRHPLSMNR